MITALPMTTNTLIALGIPRQLCVVVQQAQQHMIDGRYQEAARLFANARREMAPNSAFVGRLDRWEDAAIRASLGVVPR